MITIDDFSEERECVYKDEKYSVRDNGAILRHPKEGKPERKKDNVWTFGDTPHNGYIYYCGTPVHRVVATAFCGEAPSVQHVVDHIDTNRQNNRPENLRWLTKLENILNNEITRIKVEYICGSIENFLKNPSLLFNHENEDPNFRWMRRVSKEEAQNALDNIKSWFKDSSNKKSSGAGFGEWIFNKSEIKSNNRIQDIDHTNKKNLTNDINSNSSDEFTWDTIEKALGTVYTEKSFVPRKDYFQERVGQDNATIAPALLQFKEYKDSLTPNALQHISWQTAAEFPLCPETTEENGLEIYMGRMIKGQIVSKTRWNQSRVDAVGKSENGTLLVKCKMEQNDNTPSIKPWSIISVHIEEGKFAHCSYSTYFNEDGADKYFTLLQGKEWTGGDVFDDYC